MRKIVVAVTGASGSIYARLLLDKLVRIREQWEAVAVVMTENAKEVWRTELGTESYGSYDLPYFSQQDFRAPFASGSGKYDTMIIIPCSMGTLGRIATGVSSDLITRAADVVLKERRRLICVVRDTPYKPGAYPEYGDGDACRWDHLSGYAFLYSLPKTIEEVAATVVDRVIDLAGLKIESFRWGG